MRTQRQVKVPPVYFRKAKDEYADWASAWWREAIQNSLDAGANDFRIEVADLEGGGARVIFSDNGKGMDERTLTEVFLALGGSQKEDGSIGGFGYAKNLLCFAHKNYAISTGHQRVEGAGGDYTHDVGSVWVDGVQLEVIMDDPYVDKNVLMNRLQSLLDMSDLDSDIRFQVNGERMRAYKPTMPYQSGTSLGMLRFNDQTYGPSKLWVRIGGLAMFPVSVWTEDSHFEGTLDLSAGSSLDLLTSNRDGLQHQHQDALSRIVQQLANERGALKCDDLIDITFNELSMPVGFGPENPDFGDQADDFPGNEVAGADGIRTYSLGSGSSHGSEYTGLSAFDSLANKQMSAIEKVSQRMSQIDTSGYPANFRIRTSMLDVESRRDPAAAYTPMVRKLGQERIQKMARAWEATVHAVLSQPIARMQGIDWHDGRPFKSGCPVNTGFVFSDQVEGLHVPHPDGAYDILMNPDIMPRFDLEDMVDLALHEATHLWVSGHHEGFTTKESTLRRGFRKHMPIAELRKTVRAAMSGEAAREGGPQYS